MKRDQFIPRNVNVVIEPAPGFVLAKQAEVMAELFKSYAKGGATHAESNAVPDHQRSGREARAPRQAGHESVSRGQAV
jgi:hypothetical protein